MRGRRRGKRKRQMRLAKTFLQKSWCHGEQEPVTEHQGVAAVLQQLSPPPPPGLPASGFCSGLTRDFAEKIPSNPEGTLALCSLARRLPSWQEGLVLSSDSRSRPEVALCHKP